MKNKLHRILGIHDWNYSQKYQTKYRQVSVNGLTGKKYEWEGYENKQDRTCKICGKIEIKIIDA